MYRLGSDGLQPDIVLEQGWDDIHPGNDPVMKELSTAG
jgi:hypothetical protein